MKVASYNILSGGFSAYDYSLESPERIPELQRALKMLDADVVGLIDTFRWDEIYTSEELKRLFGYQYSTHINLNDERLRSLGVNNGVALLSRIPLVKAEKIRISTRDAIKAQVVYQEDSINIFVVYLDDQSEDTRLSQIDALLEYVNENVPTLIFGDFNMIAPANNNRTKESLAKFFVDNPLLVSKYQTILDSMLRSEAYTKLIGAGFNDAGADNGNTFPTKLWPSAEFDSPILRLDYCFHTSDIKVTDFEIVVNKHTHKTSDHFPIKFNVC